MLLSFKEPPEFDKVNFTYAGKVNLLLSCKSDSTSVDGVETHPVLLGQKCEPGTGGVCLKILPGKSCTG